jgi:hypothetical protein
VAKHLPSIPSTAKKERKIPKKVKGFKSKSVFSDYMALN